MKINLPEYLILYCQVYRQVVPPVKINSLENLKIEILHNMKISRITVYRVNSIKSTPLIQPLPQ